MRRKEQKGGTKRLKKIIINYEYICYNHNNQILENMSKQANSNQVNQYQSSPHIQKYQHHPSSLHLLKIIPQEQKNPHLQAISKMTNQFKQNQEYQDNESWTQKEKEVDVLLEHKQLFESLLLSNQFLLNLQSKKYKHYKKCQIQIQTTIFKQNTLENYLSLLFRQLNSTSIIIRDSFTLQMRNQKHFKRFLQYVYYTYPQSTVNTAFKYFIYIWQIYFPYRQLSLTMKQSIKISIIISQMIFTSYQQNCQFHNFTSSLQELLSALTITFILVVRKFGRNPLLEKERIGCLDKVGNENKNRWVINNNRMQSQE